MTIESNEDKLLARIFLDAEEDAQPPPTEDELLLYASGYLPAEAVPRIERYLDRTPEAAARVEAWAASRRPSAFEWVAAMVSRIWGSDKTDELRKHLAQGLARFDEIVRLLQGPAKEGAASASGSTERPDLERQVLVIFAKEGQSSPETGQLVPEASHLVGPLLWHGDSRIFDVEIGEEARRFSSSERETLRAALSKGDQQLAEAVGEWKERRLCFAFHIAEDIDLDDAWFKHQVDNGRKEINIIVRREVAEP